MSREHKVMPLSDKFERRFIPEPTSGCWLWIGALHGGYGWLRASKHGKRIIASRLSWELRHGAIPPRLCVCHRCDVPSCVNPDHLFLGTQADNMHDMKAKGRARALSGEANGFSKLTRDRVRAIRERYEAGDVTQETLAREFGVDQTTISRVVLGINWSRPDAP